MNRTLAFLLTVAIVAGMPAGMPLLTGLIAPEDVIGAVSVLLGVALGTFAPDIYRMLRGA